MPHWIIFALSALAVIAWSALCYAVKGGQHRPVKVWLLRLAGADISDADEFTRLPNGFHKALHAVLDGKIVSTIMFSAMVLVLVLVTDRPLEWLAVIGLPFGILSAVLTVLAAAAGWLGGVSPSMGEEVGGTGGEKGAWGQYVDALRPDGRPAFKKGYGFQKCMQRGVWMGACLALAIGSLWFLPFAALMPFTAWLGITIEQNRNGATDAKPNASWWIHEWIFPVVCPGIPLVIIFLV